MNNKMILLLVTLLVLFVGVASASDVSDDTLAADSADIVQDAPTIDNAVSVTTEIVDNNVSKKANDNQMNYHENDDVAVSKDTTTIQDTTDKNMKTATQVNVYNYDQLVNSVNDARYSNTDEYVINLRYGNYYANTALGWGEATGTTRKLVINGNGNTLDGQNEHFFIETIPGYSLVLNNIKLTNYAYESAAVIFNHGGEVTINSSTFTSNRATDNGAVIYNSFGGKINIISSNFTGNSANYGAVIYNDNATVNITSSIFENNCADTEGGVIYSKNNANVNIISSNFTNNSIDSEGSGNALGGVIVNSNSTMNISYSNFIKNNATVGGVIFNQLSDISIASSNFTDNNANYGGVFYNIYGGVNLTYSNFTNNRATNAGGVGYITNGSVNFAYSNLISNNATSGGAVYALNASVNILNSNVTSNNATNGGVLYNDGAKINIASSNFTSNSATNMGGVLYNDGAKINIASSNFTSNSASNQGGVLFNNIGNVTINSSNFTSNSATGGGVIMVYDGSITINNTNFNVNHANEGGVLFNFDGNVQVISDNFISNTADNIGGAIVNREGVVNVTSSKFIKNTAGQRGSIYNNRTLSLDNSVFYENVPLNFELVEHDGDYTLNYKPDGFISFGSIAIYSDANVTPVYTGSFNNMDIPIGNHTLRMVINGTDPTIFRDNTFIFKKGEYIDSINVSDYQSLVNAVECAKSCESDIFTINLLPGNYIATASMTWGDAYGSTRKLIINGNGLTLDGNATHQFMNVKDGYELESNNITITNYTASAGSVIDNEGTVKITDSILTKNVAADVGGVIFNKGTGIIDIDRCNLTNNSATNGGGVIYTIGNSTVNINSSNFTDNNASDFQSLGGAIFNNENCTVNINLSRFTNNCAGFNGGSVLHSMGTVNINNSVIADNNVPDRGVITNWGLLNIGYSNFTNNTSQGTAGVLYNGFGGNANIISSNFKDNSATSEGGVIYTYDDISIENTNFTNNSACDGGAIYKLTGSITINHADFIDNRATNNGGAIKNNGDLYIRYVNFINNTAANYGGAIYGYMGPKISYCNFTGNTPSDFIIRNGRIEPNQEVYIDVYAFQIYLDDEDTPVYGGSEAYGGSLSDYSVVKGHNIRLVVYDQYEDNFHDNVFYLDQVSYDSAVHNYDELVEAVEAAKGFDGDNFTIVLLPGNYNATSNMTWADATGTTRKLIIEGNGLTLDGKDRYQFMNLTSGYTLELSNITLTRYNATNGGAIYNHGGNVTVTDAIFINDSSTYKGGAIYNEAGSVNVNNTNFTGNRANEYDGGALYNYDGNLIVINSNFTNNVGGYSGGAIYDYNGSVTVTGSTFTANNGTIHSGGAIASVIDGGSLDISDSKFINNIASKGGGAIYIEGFMNITGSNFINNTATERGGAIYNYYRSNVNVTGSNFINNTATERGGAIYNHAYSNVNVTGSNFINNTATDCGGAIYNYNCSNVNVTGSNFTKNNATKFGGAIHNDYYSNATITGSNFTQNNATWGGAISNYNNSNVNVTGSNFINNTATELGGAIYYNNSNLNVTGSNFINNTATERGGAIYKEGGSVKSSDSTFYGNTPLNYIILDDDGQYSIKLENDDGFITTGNVAIYVDDETTPSYVGDNLDDFILPFGKHTIKLVVNGTDLSKFSNNTFILDLDASTDNIDVSDYQSLFDAVEYAKTTNYDNFTINLLAGNYNATVDMTWADATGTVRKIIINGNGITLNGNNSHQFMQVASGYTLILNNITFVNYTAAKGAVVDNHGTLCINNSNFTHNTATQYGGAIYNNNIGDVNVTNSRFYGNTPSNYVITNENGPYVIKLDSDDSFIDMDTVAIYLDDETAPRYVGSDLSEYILPLGEHTITLVVNGTNQDTFTNNTFIMDANIDTNNVAVSDYDGLAAMVEYAKTSRYTNFTINLLPGDYNATCDMFWGETTYRYLTLTIEGNGIILNGNFTHQFMHVNYGYGLKLNNITLTNYTSKYGGAINNGGNVTVTASNITHNNATYGGAIYNSHNLVIVNSNITYNNASDGGAIYNYRDTYVVAISNINDSNLTYNYASNGGAVYNLGIFAVTDSNLTYNNASYGGAINNGGNVTVTGSNLTYNNVTDYGGAISVDSGNVEVASSKFTDNHARRGSAISIVRGSLGVTSSKFTDNYASGNGGVIYNFEGNVSISSSNFTNNSALFYSGAAIYNYGNINISLSNFTDNKGYDGGAIVNCLNANVTSSNFINNSASNDGGAIWNGHNGNINITSSNFTDNNASRGGAVHNGMNVVVTINNSSFINNSANYDGGAIYNDEGEIAVMNSNFTANTPENFLIQDKKIDLIDNDSYIDVDVVSVYLDDDTCVYTGSLDGYTVPSNHTIRLVVNGSDTNTFCNNIFILPPVCEDIITIEVSCYTELADAVDYAKSVPGSECVIYLQRGDYTANTDMTWGDSKGGIRKLVIEGNGQVLDGIDQYQFMTVLSGYTLVLNNITFINYYAVIGSVIDSSGIVNITSSNFVNNSAWDDGGVIYNDYDSNINIYNSNFINNSAQFGGVIYADGGNINIDSSNFTDNFAYVAGVIYMSEGNLNILSSDFTSNNASSTGVIYNVNGNIYVEYSNFTSNIGRQFGGAISNLYGFTHVEYSNFINNSASGEGGAIYNDEGEITVMNSNFTGNTPENFIIQDKMIWLINNDSYIDVDIVSVYLDDDDTCVYTGSLDGYTVPSNHTIRLMVNGSDTNTFCNNFFILPPLCEDIITINVSYYMGLAYAVDYAKTVPGSECVIYLQEGAYVACTNMTWGDSKGGIRKLIIEGNGQVLDGINQYQFMTVLSGYTLILNNITFINYSALSGSVINSSGFVNITSSNFINNSAQWYGSVISNHEGNINIVSSNFINNSAQGDGAITSDGGNINIDSSNFTDNYADHSASVIAMNEANLNIVSSNFRNNYVNYPYSAGVIYVEDSIVNITSSNFTNNTGFKGGVMYNVNGITYVEYSNFTSNIGIESGGAIYNVGGTTHVDYSNFISNNATSGGAIFNTGSIHVKYSNFTQNNATDGGAIANDYGSNANITGSIFTQNNADNYGGAIENDWYSNASITGSKFIQNTATSGGAIANDYQANASITGSSFTNNSANIGGAIYNDYDSKIIINKSNFINNSASDEAGAIYNNDSEIAVMNSNYTGNTPANFIINNNIIVLINDDGYITVGDETYYTKDDKIYYTVNGTNPDTFRNNTYVLSKEDVTISYDAIADTVYRDNVTITGKLSETSGNPLQDVTVKITINNNEVYYNQTDSNGEFSLTTVVNRGGRNNVTIECYEDYYNSNKVNTTFNAEKLNAQITCDAIANAKYHENVTITGKLQETNGNAIKNDTVKITVNNKETYYNQTDSNGAYRFTILANKTGINNVTVEYAGYNYNCQQVKKTFNVNKQSTQITIEAINSTGYLGNITITGKLKESTGSPIQNAIINISINDEKYSAKTDKNGTYKLTTTANTVGTNNVKIVYEGNENYNRSEKTTTLNIPKQDTKITVKTVNTTIDNTQINITVTNKATGKAIPNAQIKIKLPNGTTITANTGSNGTVTQKLTLPAGTNKIIINYTGSNVYNPSNVTASVNVVKINTKITAKTVNSTIDNVSINVTLKTADNKAVSNAKINVYDKNNKVIANATTNGNGVANIKLNLTAGTQTLTVKYAGNGTYNASNATVSVNVVKRNTKVTGTVKNNTVSNTTLELTLTATTLNKAISKATITVLDKNGKALANATTDGNGKATVKLNLTAGTQTITIKYAGNGTYNPSNTTVTVNVVKINTKITVKTVNSTIGNVSINVTLKTADNKVVSNAKISVYDKNNKVIANATTNGNGTANIKLNLTAGTQTLTVKYAGNGTYNASNTTATVNVVKISPKITLNATTPVTVNQTITLSATVKDSNGKALTGNVTFKINGTTVKTVALTNGVANATTKINSNGTYTVTATYNGNANYTTATANNTVKVNSVSKLNTTLKIAVNNTAPRVNDNVKVTVTLKDSSNKAVANQNVTLKIANKSYALTTDKNGNANTTYRINKTDSVINVTATFKANGNYLASSNSTNITRRYQADMELLTGSFDTKPGDTVKLIAHIQDNHVDIDGGQLVFKLNGLSLKDENGSAVIVKIKNGLAILEYKIPDTLGARTHNLTAVYASNDYGRVELTTPMTIGKYTTHIDVNPLYTTNNKILIQAQIVDQNNQALNKQTAISIKLNGKSYTLNTINGTINYQINATLSDGYYNVTIKSGENGKYLGATANTVLIKTNTTINTNYINNTLNNNMSSKSGDIKTGSIMSILTGASTVKPGDRLKLIAHLSEDQIDISGGQLVFKLNGVSLKDENGSAVVVNIRDGLGILDYKIPDTLGARTHNLTAVYSSAKYGRVDLSTDLTMNRLNTHIEIDPIFTTTSTAYIKASILDDNNQKINKETSVVIKIDGKSYSFTNSNGTINFKVPTNITKGIHQITIIAGENGKYISSRKNTVLIRT